MLEQLEIVLLVLQAISAQIWELQFQPYVLKGITVQQALVFPPPVLQADLESSLVLLHQQIVLLVLKVITAHRLV